jgi:hypothetical protein
MSRTVTVSDHVAPVIASVKATPNVLWPPDHRLVPVVVSVVATDNSGSASCRISAVASDEPVSGYGAGHTSPDWIVTGNLTLRLREERLPCSDGRVYTITVTCSDASGNAASASATVEVPHDARGRGRDDDGCRDHDRDDDRGRRDH